MAVSQVSMRAKVLNLGMLFFRLSLFLLFHSILERIARYCGVFYETDLPRSRAQRDEKLGVPLTLQVGPDTGPGTTGESAKRALDLVSATSEPQLWAFSRRPLHSQFPWFGPPWKAPSPE